MNFEMIHNAKVGVSRDGESAMVEVNDRYTHRFSPAHPISKALNTFDENTVASRLDGGNFFFVGDHLVDYRDRNYRGFIHTDNNIMALIDNIGLSVIQDATGNIKNVKLSRVWDKRPFSIEQTESGGKFDSRLTFVWNPFHRVITSTFEIVRLLCMNGMVGMSTLFNSRIPLINRWSDHLNMAADQVQHKLVSTTSNRFNSMIDERASVLQCQQVVKHALLRLNEAEKNNQHAEARKLLHIATIADPSIALSDHYRSNVFSQQSVASQIPAHLTTFDIYNMITEMRTHFSENDKSTNNTLDLLANRVVFDNHIDVNTTMRQRYMKAPQSVFSNPDEAFFGVN